MKNIVKQILIIKFRNMNNCQFNLISIKNKKKGLKWLNQEKFFFQKGGSPWIRNNQCIVGKGNQNCFIKYEELHCHVTIVL